MATISLFTSPNLCCVISTSFAHQMTAADNIAVNLSTPFAHQMTAADTMAVKLSHK